MDTDDLSDEAYAIIEDAHGVSALFGSELAVSGSRATSEAEFLRCISSALRAAAGSAEDSWEDYEVFRSASHFRTFCRSLNRRVRELRYRSSNS